MKYLLSIILLCSILTCKNHASDNNSAMINLEGTWKMIYAETKENDSTTIKDLSTTSFIKIINKTHFAFFNQDHMDATQFYSGGGSYTLKGNEYVETLNLTSVDALRGHIFPFTIEIKGDTLVQTGVEKIAAAKIHREIIEKYIKIK